MSVLTKHRFSVHDYHRMAEAGVLAPDARVELLDGEVHDSSPISPLHGGVTNRLHRFFTQRARGRFLVSVQNPVQLDAHSEPQPDLMLLRPCPDDYMRRHPVAREVFLLVEVADSSLDYDKESKLPAYARAGVAEVWIVNLSEEWIEVFREPNFLGYSSKTLLGVGSKARPERFPSMALDVRELFA